MPISAAERRVIQRSVSGITGTAIGVVGSKVDQTVGQVQRAQRQSNARAGAALNPIAALRPPSPAEAARAAHAQYARTHYTVGALKGQPFPPQYHPNPPDTRSFFARHSPHEIATAAAEAMFGNTANLAANQLPLSGPKYNVDKVGLGIETAGLFTGPLRVLGAGTKAALALKAGKGAKEVLAAAKVGHAAPVRGAVRAVVGAGAVAPVEKTAAFGVADVLPAAKKARAAQEAGYSVERGKRFGNAGAQFGQAGGGLAGHRAAKGQLRGELPKIDFSRLRAGGYTQAELDRDINRIYEHPALRQGAKTSAADGLENMFLKGLAPQPKQIELLNTVFGPQETAKLVHQSLGQRFADVLGVPRTLMASADVSAPFRQGLVAGARHPVLFSKDLPGMFKALVSEHSYQGILDEIHARPTFPKMQEAGVAFTELGRNLNKREEQFISSLAERPVRVGGKNINLPGRIVHASGRAYTGFLDRLRADMFDEQLRLAAKAGVNTEDPKQLRAIADLVNNATGRGGLPGKTLENSAPLLNALFFSPRLISSRVNMIGLNPHWYVQLTPFARRQALRSMVQLGAAATAVLGVGAYFGAKVGTDPRSADFAKLKRGNTRYDVLGGFQQYIRVAAQMATGQVVSSATGDVSSTGPGPLQRTRFDIGLKFLQGKTAPVPSVIIDALKGTNYAGQPFSVKKEIAQHTIPLVAQDAWSIYKDQNSVRNALIGYGIASFGIGSQTYGNPNTKKAAEKYKAWQTQSAADWKAMHPGQELPALVIRAKRDSDAVAALTAKLPAAAKDNPAQLQARDHAELSMLLGYLVQSKPDMARYQSSYDQLLSSGPLTIHKAIPAVRNTIYGHVLDQFNTKLSEYRTRKTYR